MVSPKDGSLGANEHPELASDQHVHEFSVVPLLDKEAWYAVAESEIAEARLHETPLSVIFIDANYFKQINQELGQQVGDEVIEEMRGLVQLIASSFRTNREGDEKNDIILITESAESEIDQLEDIKVDPGHVGGDEFAVLCHTDEEGTKAIITRLRNAFDAYLETRPELQKIRVGLSIGASTLKPGMSDITFMRKAELAMHQDKLDQLPDLEDYQQAAIDLARLILGDAGVRLIDAPKYWRKYPPLPDFDQNH